MRWASKVIAAAALTACVASQAQACDYLVVSFDFKGTETRQSNTGPLGGNTAAEQGSIVYYLPTTFGTSLNSFNASSSALTSDIISTGLTGNGFTFGESLTGQTVRPSTRSVTINGCITGATSGFDPACSTVNFVDALSLGTMGGDRRTITGTLTGLRISEGYGSVQLGLASYPVIPLLPVATNPTPEAATWAMMILGMGAVGTALRRRRATRPSAATA